MKMHMTVGSRSPDRGPLDAMQFVDALLHQMKGAALTHNMLEFQEKSDELSTFARAYLVPSIPDNWQGIKLTRQQKIIADLMLSKLGKVVTYDAFMNALYFDRPNSPPEDNCLKVRAFQIRKLLKDTPYQIETVYGVGYRMVPKPNNSLAA